MVRASRPPYHFRGDIAFIVNLGRLGQGTCKSGDPCSGLAGRVAWREPNRCALGMRVSSGLAQTGMKLVVTIPALNEEKTIALLVRGVPRNIPGIDEVEVIVVNDGSTDTTATEAADAGATVISLPGGGGLGMVFRNGFDHAMRRGADFIVNIDGDGQLNPADIAKLVQPLLEDRADFVTCSRFADPALRPTMPVVKYHGNRAVTGIINWVCGGTCF